MIDIRQLAQELARQRAASDDEAFTRYAHVMLKTYGQALLASLAEAIHPTQPEETPIVLWLRDQIIEIAKQIPDPKE